MSNSDLPVVSDGSIGRGDRLPGNPVVEVAHSSHVLRSARARHFDKSDQQQNRDDK